MPNQDDRRESRMLWSMVSKAADSSRRQRHDTCCEPMADHRSWPPWRLAGDRWRWRQLVETATLQFGACSWWWWWLRCRPQARREPQRDPGKRSCGVPNICVGPLWKENFWIFLFKMVHSGALYRLFLGDGGAPKPCGAPGSLPSLPHPLDGPGRPELKGMYVYSFISNGNNTCQTL